MHIIFIEGERMIIRVSININNQEKIFKFDNKLSIKNTIQTIVNNSFNSVEKIEYIFSTRNKRKLIDYLTFEDEQILTGDKLYVNKTNKN